MTKKSLYNDFGTWMKSRFSFKVQKISINAGFTCPNRDGQVGRGGCTFCDNETFSPSYCMLQQSITDQLVAGKSFFAQKYPDMKYLAYFQSYTNSYGSLDDLIRKYEEALSVPDVVGIVIGTRPDCVSDELLQYLAELQKRYFVLVEYGIESVNDETLRRINRGHSFECSRQAIQKTHDYGLLTGGHIILGLPGEDRTEMLHQADVISRLPLDILKIHQLQVITSTVLACEYAATPFHVFTVEEYIELLTNFIMRLRPTLVLDRFVSQSPAGKVIAPRWGLKNYQFTNLLNNYMETQLAYQGKLYQANDKAKDC